MNKEQHKEFMKLAADYAAMPSLRKGQAYFNALSAINPELTKEITGTDADPFYDNSKIGRFFQFIYSNVKD